MSKQLLEEIRQLNIRLGGQTVTIERLNARIVKNGKKLQTLVERNTRLKYQRDAQRALLIKLRDSGQWFISAVELEHDVDGEELLKAVEALTGPRVAQ